MASQADITALCNLIQHAQLVIGTDPIPRGGIESLQVRYERPVAHEEKRAEFRFIGSGAPAYRPAGCRELKLDLPSPLTHYFSFSQ